MSNIIIYVDLDDVLADFTLGCEQHFKNKNKERFPQGKVGFFEALTPISGAIEAVNILRQNSKVEVYILTAPSCMNPHSYSEKRIWTEKHFGFEFTKNLIICGNKSLLKGHVLIDDNVSGKGQENFEAELVHFGSEKFPSWNSVLDYLNKGILCD